MIEISVFVYGLLSAFVLLSAEENRRRSRPNPAMVTAMGWGLFSMSSTLAILLGGVALALLFGATVPELSQLALR